MAQLDDLKALLCEAETDYSHAFARGDWEACSFHKAKVAKLRGQIGRIIKQNLKLSFA